MARLQDGFVQLEVVKQRFDDAFDLAEMLARLIAEKESAGADVSEFKIRLNKAEAEKAQLLEVLRVARLRRSIPVSAVPRPELLLPPDEMSGKKPYSDLPDPDANPSMDGSRDKHWDIILSAAE
jgi:hypothetical protein